jgi:hypothetical protein
LWFRLVFEFIKTSLENKMELGARQETVCGCDIDAITHHFIFFEEQLSDMDANAKGTLGSS